MQIVMDVFHRCDIISFQVHFEMKILSYFITEGIYSDYLL